VHLVGFIIRISEMYTFLLVVSLTSAAFFCILLPADLCSHITVVVYIRFSRSFVKLVWKMLMKIYKSV